MARVTVEDCVDKVDNRFDLVLLAGHRARMISTGAEITIDRDNDKNPVVALREIAEETVSPEDLKEDLIHSLQKHVEVDEPEADIVPVVENVRLVMDVIPMGMDAPDQPDLGHDRISEEELLRGLESLVPPDRSDDY